LAKRTLTDLNLKKILKRLLLRHGIVVNSRLSETC